MNIVGPRAPMRWTIYLDAFETNVRTKTRAKELVEGELAGEKVRHSKVHTKDCPIGL